MTNTYIKKYLFRTLITCAMLLTFPFMSHAMSISVEASRPVSSGDTALFTVFLNTDKEEINTIDGSIEILGNYNVTSINTANSLFTLWPNKPSLNKTIVTFTGGATAGISGSRLKVFSLAIKPTSTGTLVFTPKNITVYKNDGIGTAVTVDNTPLKITVGKSQKEPQNDLAGLILDDKTPPHNFDVIIGRDNQTFDGKYFASFNTTDDESGVNRYEVSENGNAPVRSGTTYILQDQELAGTLTVYAIDNAGNTRTVEVNMRRAATHHIIPVWLSVLLIVLSVIIIVFIGLKILRKRWRR